MYSTVQRDNSRLHLIFVYQPSERLHFVGMKNYDLLVYYEMCVCVWIRAAVEIR